MARPKGSKDTIKRVRKKMNPEDKKVVVGFQIKKKYVKKAKKLIQPLVDKINKKPTQ